MDDDVLFCDNCGDLFLTESALKEHENEVHNISEKSDNKMEENKEPSKKKQETGDPPRKKPGPASKTMKKKVGPASRVKKVYSSDEEEIPVKNKTVEPASKIDHEKKSDSKPFKDESIKHESIKHEGIKQESIKHESIKHSKETLPAAKPSENEKTKKRPKIGPASKVKRPRSPSTEDEANKEKVKHVKPKDKKDDATKTQDGKEYTTKSQDRKENSTQSVKNDGPVKKKIKAGPKSRVKRERSLSPDLSTDLSPESDIFFRKVLKLDEDKNETEKAKKKEDEAEQPLRFSFSSDDSDSNDEKKKQKSPKERVKLKHLLTPKLSKDIKEKSSPKPAKSSPKSDKGGVGFALLNQVKEHDNPDGPTCPKCNQVCKDNANLKNHLLSHFYLQFYELLPSSKPYPCPVCEKPSRDRITLVRHYAFSHNKALEVTGIDFSQLGGGSGRKRSPNKKATTSTATPQKKTVQPSKTVKSPKLEKIVSKAIISDDDSSDDEDLKKLKEKGNKKIAGISALPPQKAIKQDLTDGTKHKKDEEKEKERKHKDKHKKKDKDRRESKESDRSDRDNKHKDHKHKDKKHKKHKEKEKEKPVGVVKPLEKLQKELTPDTTSNDSLCLENSTLFKETSYKDSVNNKKEPQNPISWTSSEEHDDTSSSIVRNDPNEAQSVNDDKAADEKIVPVNSAGDGGNVITEDDPAANDGTTATEDAAVDDNSDDDDDDLPPPVSAE